MAAVATAERGLIVYQLENQPSEFRRIESPLKHQVNSNIQYKCICTDCWNYVLAVLNLKNANYFKGGVLSFGMACVLLWCWSWWHIKINCHLLHLGVCLLPVMGLHGLKGVSWNALLSSTEVFWDYLFPFSFIHLSISEATVCVVQIISEAFFIEIRNDKKLAFYIRITKLLLLYINLFTCMHSI